MIKIFVVVLLFFCCCSQPQRNYYFELPELKKITQMSLIDPPPPVISFTSVYVIGINDSISESSFVKLQEVYKSSYEHTYSEFSNFLFDALNQKIKIDTRNPKTYLYYSQTFLNDLGIIRLYEEKGLKGIINQYCITNNDFYTLNRGSLTLNQINSISYYFFINRYIRVDDDYYATISYRKLSSALPALQ